MADVKSGPNPLFLREEELRQGMELLFFAYRDFTADPDAVPHDHGVVLDPARRVAGHRPTTQGDRAALVGGVHTEHRLRERRLARTRLADERQQLAGTRDLLRQEGAASDSAELDRLLSARETALDARAHQLLDGWPGLRARYELPHRDVRGVEHDLAYRGIGSRDVDVTELGSDVVEIGGREVPARSVRLTARKMDITLWYSSDEQWLALESVAKGGRIIRYELI